MSSYDDEITKYEDKHRPQNQERIVEGFYINPVLRSGFDNTANEDRDPQEISDWWGRPFILEREFSHGDDSYHDYIKRLKSYNGDFEPESQESWEKYC